MWGFKYIRHKPINLSCDSKAADSRSGLSVADSDRANN